MARMSAEGRSAAAFRAGGRSPPVPDGFDELSAKLWRDIVKTKPIGWFDAGSLSLLALYCRTMSSALRASERLAATAVDAPEFSYIRKQVVALNTTCTSLAVKLRLSVQNNVDRKSRMLDETVEPSDDAEAGLLGGSAVWGGKQAVN